MSWPFMTEVEKNLNHVVECKAQLWAQLQRAPWIGKVTG